MPDRLDSAVDHPLYTRCRIVDEIERLADEDPEGAAFMIAEVATTLLGVAWRPLGSLRAREIGPEVNEILRALHHLAIQAPAPSSLAAYVATSFEELLA